MRKVIRFLAKDGKLFNSKQECLDYELDKIREYIDNNTELDSLRFSANDKFKVVMSIIRDSQSAMALYREIQYWLLDENEEEQ